MKAILIFLFLVFLFKAIFLLLSDYLVLCTFSGYQMGLQNELCEKVLNARYRFLLDRKAGHVANIMIAETSRAASGIRVFLSIFVESVAVGVYVACSLAINWPMTLGALVLASISFCAFRPLIRGGRLQGQIRLDAYNEMQSLVHEAIGSIAAIKGMGKESFFRRRFANLAATARRAMVLTGMQKSLILKVAEPLVMLVICGMIYVGLQHHKADVASILLLTGVLYRCFRRMGTIPALLHRLVHQVPSLEAVEKMRANASAMCEREGGDKIAQFERLLFERVQYAYREDTPVLRGVDIELARGEMVGIVGPSGGGKTTLIGMTMGLLPDYGGGILVNGSHQLRNLDLRDWRGRIGYVGQEILLFHTTIAENIAFFQDVSREDIERAAEQAHCLEFLRDLPDGLDTIVGDRGAMLSGGQRQRLALARALVGNPELLILDEATSDLDAESEVRIQHTIESLRGRVAILAIAHRLSTIREADRIYLLDEGVVAEQGSCAELIERGGVFARMFNQQHKPGTV